MNQGLLLAHHFRGSLVPRSCVPTSWLQLQSDSCAFQLSTLNHTIHGMALLRTGQRAAVSDKPLLAQKGACCAGQSTSALEGMTPDPLTVPETGAFYSEETRGTDPQSLSFVCFSPTGSYEGTWLQGLQCCLGNEKSHGKGEPQVRSFNSTTDSIQQVQNLNRGKDKHFQDVLVCHSSAGRVCPSMWGQTGSHSRILCAFLLEMLLPSSFRSRPAVGERSRTLLPICSCPSGTWGVGFWVRRCCLHR